MNEANLAVPRPLSQFLRMAVVAGVESAVRIHIDRGDDLNARDGNGMTPLMLSAARNKPAICRLLLDAGADHCLVDPSGKTAQAIAIAAGAHEVAAVLLAAEFFPPVFERPAADLELKSTAPGHSPLDDTQPGSEAHEPPSSPEPSFVEAPAPKAAREVIALDELVEFELSGWEAEEYNPPPEANPLIEETAGAIQVAISAHEPIDSSAEWEEIDAYLPEQSTPLARADDDEGRARLRLLLLRAIREGSVPRLNVEELSTDDDRSANPEAEALLSRVINDLGAELDERFEYSCAGESFEVFVNPDEAPGEEDTLDEALAAVDSAISPRNEPLRIYQREFQRLRLISAQEEVAIGQAMENAMEAALDALAAWPTGVAWTLAVGAEVVAGIHPLARIAITGAEGHTDPTSADASDTEAPAIEGEEDTPDDEDESQAKTPALGASAFKDTLEQLGALTISADPQGSAWIGVRDLLAALRLNRSFLVELCDVEGAATSAAGVRYTTAMQSYQRTRDRMAAANLKLVFHIAKKYQYSGEPLGDLTQEGNLGLLKAIERFDWRRGFKFSTYATWWIRQQIGRYVADKCRTIRIPVHIYEKSQRLQRESQAFESVHGRPPEIDEIAARTEIPAAKVPALRRLAVAPLSIHELPIEELVVHDDREIFATRDPEEIVFTTEIRREIDNLLSTLTAKEQRVIRLRFGLGVQDSLTLDEIGKRYEVTRERIRQIEAKALKTLKQPSRMSAFMRTALGVQTAPAELAPSSKEGDGASMDAIESHNESESRQHTAPSRPPPGQPSKLDRLLADATELGIPIDDDRAGPSGHIWVNFVTEPDNHHRQLARKLVDFGFEFWPGKGYWK